MNEKKWDVYVCGDVNVDLAAPGVKRIPAPGQEEEIPYMGTYPGGGAALFTMGIGKLGLHPVFQGVVGDDFYGRMLKEELEAVHVDTSLLAVDKEGSTGISISFTDASDRSFLTYRGTGQRKPAVAADMAIMKQARHIHVTGYEGSRDQEIYETFLKRVKEETEASVSFDVGWDAGGEWSRGIYQLLPFIDILFMNETEALHYSRLSSADKAAADFAEVCGQAVVKLGSRGAVAVKEGAVYYGKAYPVTAVDTTGAGDSFNAGYVYGFLKGLDVPGCLRCGNGCGALSVTRLGGNTGFPDEAGLLALIGETAKCDGKPAETMKSSGKERESSKAPCTQL